MITILRDSLDEVDPDAAGLIHLLFRNKIAGERVLDMDMIKILESIDRKGFMISNPARQIFRHPEFLMFRVLLQRYYLIALRAVRRAGLQSPHRSSIVA